MKIATRKSLLATYQAEMAKRIFEEQGVTCEFLFLETSGDRKTHPLFAGKGIFIKELQKHLLEGTADIAVHSLKDLPIKQTSPLALHALLPRAAKEDVLILSPRVIEESGLNSLSESQRIALNFEDLKNLLFKSDFFKTASMGTSSLRRTLQIKQYFGSEIDCKPLRGNVNSRLEKVQNSDYSCIILAKAGLERLNLYSTTYMFTLDPTVFVPSAGQGIVAVEAYLSDVENSSFINMCSTITSPASCIEAGLERAVLHILGSDCYTPVGIYFDGSNIYISTEVNSKFLFCKIKITAEEFEYLYMVFEKHKRFYASFFEEICTSDLAKRIQEILVKKKFIEK